MGHRRLPKAGADDRRLDPPSAGRSLGMRRRQRLRLACIVVLWAVLPIAAPAGAQPTGAIEGVVVDANDDPLPGVVVELAGPAVERETVSGLDGAFTFTELPTGDYLVTAALSGFETWEVAVPVRQGETAQVTTVLQIERLMETLTVVAEAPRTFATNVVAEPMIAQQAAITSVLAVVDNLPGVSIQEGDSYGFDDWSSSITMRGFQVLQDEAQIGTTIDGFPNGTSDYWSGGSKANRFVDTANMGSVEVSQGTADVASRSIEALGGTFHFSTADPKREAAYTASVTLGEHDAQRYYVRADTGSLFGGETYAWFSAARQVATDWVQGSAGNEREHVAAKVVSSVGRVDLAGYLAYDDIHEENYQRLFAESEFLSNPEWDRLIGEWTDIPVHQPGLSPRLADDPCEHVRLPEGRRDALGCLQPERRRLLPTGTPGAAAAGFRRSWST